MTAVKICGLRRVEHALAAAEAGAVLLGFVFAPSRRRIEPELAADIVATVRTQFSPRIVGIFVNERPAIVNQIAEYVGLDYIQLSGDEAEEVQALLTRPIIKTLHVTHQDDRESIAQRANAGSAEILHLDTGHAGAYGGTGAPFDWTVVPRLQRTLLLAGGLHAGNVQQAIRQVRPWGVDVSSGVETDGIKDVAKIRGFIRQTRSATAEETVPA